MQSGYSILLTGGAGFLGRAILHELLDDASPLPVKEIRVLDLQPLEGVSDERIQSIEGDVRDREILANSCAGVDVLIHAAALVDWGTKSESEIMSVNYHAVLGIIEACSAMKVKALVFTSSLDVLFNGKPLIHVNEDTPYPESHSTSYCKSKFLAETEVLKANGNDLKTCSLRPADIYGEGDPYHIGSLISMARGGFYVRLGNGKSLCQHVYVGNVAHAHILAAAALLKGNSRVEGHAFFITDGPPSNFFCFFDSFVEGIGYRIWPRNLWLSRWFAFSLGCISETVAFLWRPVRKYSPRMSRFAVTYTCTDYTFDSERAKEAFGFIPKYSREEAFVRTVAWFCDHS